MQKLKNRYKYSYILLRQLVITDFKLRYQGSFLGYIWSLLRPLALFGVLYFVFGVAFNLGDTIPHYPVYLLIGIVLWNYFIEVTVGSVSAIVSKGDLLRKINFPKYVIVLSGSVSALINLAINFFVVAIFMYFNHVSLTLSIVWLPILIIELFIFSIAVAFLLSSLFVKFRDVNYIWEVIIQALFYATPVLYPIVYVIEHASLGAAQLMMLNPVAQIIQDVRYVAITDSTQTITSIFGTNISRLYPVLIVLLVCVVALPYFRARSKFFAEEV